MSEFEFDFKVKPRRPFWKDFVLFCSTVFGVWGGTHVIMNYDAFAQIVDFKVKTLKASVLEEFEPEPEVQKELTKVERVKRTKFRNQKIKPRNQAKKLFETLEVFPSDNRLVISRIGKNVPLITVPDHQNWQQLEQNIQKGLQGGAAVHPISHAPGNFGNFFVTGHSSYYAWDKGRFKDMFALLHEVKIGDIIDVYWEGQKYQYKIRAQKVVPPTEVSILNQPANLKIITLMTCTPVGTNKNRLILVGELQE